MFRNGSWIVSWLFYVGVNASQNVGVRWGEDWNGWRIREHGLWRRSERAVLWSRICRVLVNIPTLLFDNTFMTFNCSAVVYQTFFLCEAAVCFFLFFFREAAVAIAMKIVSYVIATLVRYPLQKCSSVLTLTFLTSVSYYSDMKSISELFDLQVKHTV